MKIKPTDPASFPAHFPPAGAPLRPARDVVFEAFLTQVCRHADRFESNAARRARHRYAAAAQRLETQGAQTAASRWLACGELGEGLSRQQMSRLFRPIRDQLTRQLGSARSEQVLASALRAAERLPESACFSPLEIY
ncbi:MAG: hypothetical protein AAGA81_04290 [Acidobacteriota bacterium]